MIVKMINFKNVTGSPKTTIAGAVIIAGSLGAVFMKLASWTECSVTMGVGATLFVMKDGKKLEK